MSDFGVCNSNLDEIVSMMPLSEREIKLARMQFYYCSTSELMDEYKDHEGFRHLRL